LVEKANIKLQMRVTQIGNSKIMWGDFVSTTIDFLIIALVVYFAIKLLGIETEKKK